MEGKKNNMIYLDTHVVVWLYAGLIENLSDYAIELIESNSLKISPIVKLEITYLRDTKRITPSAQTIIEELQSRLGLTVCDAPFDAVINKADELNWTRDPFDRIIVANAMCQQSKLLTKDRTIRKHFKQAYWTAKN